MSEEDLVRKLLSIEALFAGATTDGERAAAGLAKDRILARLKEYEQRDPPIEYKFTMSSMWSKKLFVALLRRYGIRPYRYRRQRYTTVMAKVSVSFVKESLWPEFVELNKALEGHLEEVTERVIREGIHAEEEAEPEIQQTLSMAG
jgi:hypothetical protein